MDTNTLTHTVGHEHTLYTLMGGWGGLFVDELLESVESEDVSNTQRWTESSTALKLNL